MYQYNILFFLLIDEQSQASIVWSKVLRRAEGLLIVDVRVLCVKLGRYPIYICIYGYI